MILDRLVAANRRVLKLVGAAHIVQMPLELYPFNDNGGWGCEWKRQVEQDALVPRSKVDRFLIDATWIRMPYERLVLFNANEESCVYLQRLGHLAGQRLPAASERTLEYVKRHHPELATHSQVPAPGAAIRDAFAMYGLILMEGQVVCAMGSAGMIGELVDGSRSMATLGMQDVCAPFIADMNELLENGIGGKVHRSEGDFELDRMNMSLAVAAALALLNCKNVLQREVGPSRQTRRSAERTGSAPPFRYHVLDLIHGTTGHRRGRSDDAVPIALHWTRGHFKDYRQGTGLFGRGHGLYWWSPHLAGRADRIVTKGYRA